MRRFGRPRTCSISFADTDGASAIYGSDAVGGVVNLILKSDYQGAEFAGRYGLATGAGDYTERSASLLAAAAGVRVTASVSASKTDRLLRSHFLNTPATPPTAARAPRARFPATGFTPGPPGRARAGT